LNCGHPFFGHEKYCPECGQANKGDRITFASFVHEIFNGFFNFDAKFWNTIIPLLISPGKVSKEYVEGKRQRFSNPFRFYLTVSVVFFLVLGIGKSLDKFKSYSEAQISQKKKDSIALAKFNADSLLVDQLNKKKKALTPEQIDSIKNEVDKGLQRAFIPEVARKNILKEVEREAKDTTSTSLKGKGIHVDFGGYTRLDKMYRFQKKNPDVPPDVALDSLKLEKSFWNRFLYDRTKVVKNFTKSEETRQEFLSQALSAGSIALFIFLPLFTIFLKLVHMRCRKTYVDHLIFVFHTQTVFFMLLTIFFIIELFGVQPEASIFLLLFLIYLFIAMKRFYGQGYLKTFIKFCILNGIYFFIASFGVMAVFLISFALY
tara:strand:+ start:97254 stop:98375 length:1122 start_codon:yes stop_codon:yes gene_type:complete